MSTHSINLVWDNIGAHTEYDKYSRDHSIDFGKGNTLSTSSAVEYLGNPDCVDPEQLFVSSVSSCHMLFFIGICFKKGLTVRQYRDQATGYLEKNDTGKMVMTRIILKPVIQFEDGVEVSQEAVSKMHHQAHKHCFIANSILTEVVVESGE